MRRSMVVLAMLLTATGACGGDSTGPKQQPPDAPCWEDVTATVAHLGQPDHADRNGSLEAIASAGGSLYFVAAGDTTVYTFTPHYDDTYWCEVKIQL